MREDVLKPEAVSGTELGNESGDEIVRRAAVLRDTFDRRFRDAAESTRAETVDVLAVAIGSGRVGVIVEQAAHIVARPTLVAIPDAEPGCRGVVGYRGRLVAVYDLDAASAAPEPKIVLVARRDPSVGFAASSVLGYHRAPRSAILAPSDATDPTRIGVLQLEEPLVVLSIDALVERLVRSEGGEP